MGMKKHDSPIRYKEQLCASSVNCWHRV